MTLEDHPPVPKFQHKKPFHITWSQTAVILIGVILFAMSLQLMSNTPAIQGYSVTGEPVYENQFSTTTALLVVIFGFFGLFIIIATKKLDYRWNK